MKQLNYHIKNDNGYINYKIYKWLKPQQLHYQIKIKNG